MKKSPNYIKKTLNEIKLELLKDKKLQLSKELYVQKLKEIFNEQVIDLKDGVETRMSSTGTDKTISLTSTNETSIQSQPKQKTNKSEKIIFLNNEIVDQNLSEIEEANHCLRKGYIQSPLWTQKNTLDLVVIMDEIREQNKILYPMENT